MLWSPRQQWKVVAFTVCLAFAFLSSCGAPRRDQERLARQYVQLSQDLNETRTRLADTRASLQEMRLELDTLRGNLEETRARKRGEAEGVETVMLEELATRVAGVEEELRAQGTLLKLREDELRLLREAVLEPGAISRGQQAVAPSQPVAPSPARPRTSRTEPDEIRKDYDEGWNLLKSKDYRGAIAQFKKFLRKHPTSSFADNAQYWVGESYYALREFDQAILEFDAVRRKYPNGDKVPAALLKQGYAFAELGDKVDARLILQEVIDRYPQSTEAAKAREKVRALGS